MFSFFVDTDCNKRGQTFRPVVRAQIQTSCNIEKNICNCNCFLDCEYCQHINFVFES